MGLKMQEGTDWLAVATVVLAIATIVLASATVWLAWGARADRIEQRNERDRRLLRAALLEQIDNCRQWLPSSPSDLKLAERRPPPATSRLTDFLEGISLPPDLAFFLTWGRGEIALRHAAHDTAVTSTPDQGLLDPYGAWTACGDLLQEIACLVRAHAKAMGHGAVAEGLARTTWEIPQPMGTDGRRLAYALAAKAGKRPRWPAGDAYASCDAASRDDLALHELARQADVLSEPTPV